MHPIIAEQAATELRQRRLDQAAVRRRVALAPRPRTVRSWRARQAARLVAVARRLDPGGVGALGCAPTAGDLRVEG